ncbi:GroES-like protein [Macrolepiota fuliginosa MF-IS2]|uniref:GroES-like protein n=1 Tax=Macrolepiota fuliginosa MF-IS2 TaxID=1400762 RepID=A0A9P6C1S1_9AGAR|nr:GroES-like protein [Macrolepiota fuliginosa MF-IS2]
MRWRWITPVVQENLIVLGGSSTAFGHRWTLSQLMRFWYLNCGLHPGRFPVHDTSRWDEFQVINFHPRVFRDHDVDVKIEFCGVCGTDVHTISGGWGPPTLPLIPGHEVIGYVTQIGKQVKSFGVGDRVGVGAQVGACFDCFSCRNGDEQYCPDHVHTYNAVDPVSGATCKGGFATAIRVHEQFVFPIPDEISSEDAAPFMCAGLTMYSALVRNGAGPGRRVGIIGLGGLGHLGVQFAKALGCRDIVVLSHTPDKRRDALRFGATHFYDFIDDAAECQACFSQTLDLVISTLSVWKDYRDIIPLLRARGRIILVGIPDDPLPVLGIYQLVISGVLVGGSKIGNKSEVVEMLKLAVEHGIRPQIEISSSMYGYFWIKIFTSRSLDVLVSSVGRAMRRVEEGRVRYRQVLRMDIHMAGVYQSSSEKLEFEFRRGNDRTAEHQSVYLLYPPGG